MMQVGEHYDLVELCVAEFHHNKQVQKVRVIRRKDDQVDHRNQRKPLLRIWPAVSRPLDCGQHFGPGRTVKVDLCMLRNKQMGGVYKSLVSLTLIKKLD